MTFTDLVYAIGDLLESTFVILPKLANIPNYTFMVIGVLGFLYWMNLQVKYNRKSRRGEGRM